MHTSIASPEHTTGNKPCDNCCLYLRLNLAINVLIVRKINSLGIDETCNRLGVAYPGYKAILGRARGGYTEISDTWRIAELLLIPLINEVVELAENTVRYIGTSQK